MAKTRWDAILNNIFQFASRVTHKAEFLTSFCQLYDIYHANKCPFYLCQTTAMQYKN